MPGADSTVLVLAVPAAVVGAASFGLGSAVQHRVAERVRDIAPLDPRLLLALVRQPLWVAGVLAVVTGLVLQLVALAFAPLALVQPLLATSILFAALFAAWLVHRRADRTVVLGCLLCVSGLSAFLLLARPRGDRSDAVLAAPPWPLAVAFGAVVAASLLLVTRSSGSTRVIALALATGVLFGVNAGLLKVAAQQFRDGGAAVLFGHWALYAVCVIGPAGFLLAQNTFQQGDAFAPALAVIRSVDPVVGVVLGVGWLGERVNTSPGVLAGEVIAAVVVIGGIALLARRTSELRSAPHSVGSAWPRRPDTMLPP